MSPFILLGTNVPAVIILLRHTRHVFASHVLLSVVIVTPPRDHKTRKSSMQVARMQKMLQQRA